MIALDRRTGGLATVVGYLVLLGILFRDPTSGFQGATADPASFLLFVGLPVAGLLAGAAAAFEGPLGSVALFLAGNYLALFGLVLGFGLVPGPGLLWLVGVVLLALAIVAVLISFRGFLGFLSVTDPDPTRP